jgi:hypothetical protein
MYIPSEKDAKNIENNFVYHTPSGMQQARYESIRAHCKTLAVYLATECPPSRELSLALTNLEQCHFWANAAIARNE